MFKEPTKIWPAWDAEINRFGEWMLVGSIACVGLPPILGILGIVGLFCHAFTRAGVAAKELFCERDMLRKKEKEGTLTGPEKKRFDYLTGELRRGARFRDVKIYLIGYTAFAVALVYLVFKTSLIPAAQCIQKGLWGF